MNATFKPITQDAIRSLLQRSDAAVEEAILRLYERQTQDEKRSHDAKYRNRRGFSGRDAALGTKYAQWIIGMRRDHKAKPGEGLHRADHKANAREIALRYTRQLLEEATEKAAARAACRRIDAAGKAGQLPILDDLTIVNARAQAQADADADESMMNAIVHQGELEEAHRVAEFKAHRDERLNESTLPPGSRVATRLFWGYQTLTGLTLSGTTEGDRLRVQVGTTPGVVHVGLVTAAGRTANGTAANRVLFHRKSAWVRTSDLQATDE